MDNNKPANKYKVQAGLVAALGFTYLLQIGEAYLAQEPIGIFLYIGLLLAIVLLVLIIRDK